VLQQGRPSEALLATRVSAEAGAELREPQPEPAHRLRGWLWLAAPA
jgi:hypothetical protein